MIFTENELKKWTLKSQKSQIAILLLNQCSISAVFPIVRFAGDQKTALTGESLYLKKWLLRLNTKMFISFWYSNITENFKNCVNPTLIACCSVVSHASQNVTHSGRILKKVQKMHWASSSHIQKHAKQQQQSPTLPSSVEFHPKNNNNNKLQWSSLIWFDSWGIYFYFSWDYSEV